MICGSVFPENEMPEVSIRRPDNSESDASTARRPMPCVRRIVPSMSNRRSFMNNESELKTNHQKPKTNNPHSFHPERTIGEALVPDLVNRMLTSVAGVEFVGAVDDERVGVADVAVAVGHGRRRTGGRRFSRAPHPQQMTCVR